MMRELHGMSGEPDQIYGERPKARGVAVAPAANVHRAHDSLCDLGTASRTALVRLWSEFYGAAPPPSISQPLLRKILAFDVQLRAAGDWPAGLEAKIEQAGRGNAKAAAAPKLSANGRLLREWNGTTHDIEVTADSYLWQGRSWRSLSAIAREITGAHWSGPRFFGLTAIGAARDNGRSCTSTRKLNAVKAGGNSSANNRQKRPSSSRPAAIQQHVSHS